MVNQLPQLQQFDAVVTADELKEVIHALPVGKSRGLDNWSNGELKLLGDDDLQHLAMLLNRVLHEAHWPDSMLDSAVTLLAKVQNPQTPQHGRPITVLATIYRLWAKVQARKMFSHIVGHLPPTLFGSIPQRSALDAAWLIQDALDQALASEHDATAVSLDLSKAYNTINRDLLQLLAQRTGWPPQLFATYRDFLDRLRRRFKIHQGLHGCVGSSVGVPEGDPIAVVAMILVTWAVTLHVEDHGDKLASYVDNWTVMSSNQPGHVFAVLQKVKEATDAMTLLLNPDKTRCFSTSAAFRKQLRKMTFHGCNLQVCNQVQDLGVGYNATGQCTSRVLHDRFHANDHKLRRLQYMPWSATRKSEVVVRMIAPAMLFGAPFASSAPSFLSMMRGRFSASIWGGNTQRNHFLAPLFSTAVVYEPFLLVMDARLQTLRRVYTKDPVNITSRWNQSVLVQPTGPLRYLFEQWLAINAQPHADFNIRLAGGTVLNVVSSDFSQLREQIHIAWCEFVASKLQAKDDFRGIELVDWQLTVTLRRQSQMPASVLGTFTVGAALFSKQKSHFLDASSVLCQHCGAEDTQFHRLFQCPFYADCRHGLPIQEMQTWPQLMTCRGFVKQPLAVQEWEKYVKTIPPVQVPPFFDEMVHLFTDGSTTCSDTAARSAWSVVLGDPATVECAMVNTGVVPGKQSNYRAEICAVLAAIQCADEGHIYVDNLAVVHGMRRFLRHGWQAEYWMKHAEMQLWFQVWMALEPKRQRHWFVHHVKSHQEFAAAQSWKDAWAIAHNGHADRLAKLANIQRTPVVLAMHRHAVKEIADLQRRLKQIFLLQSRVLAKASTSGSVAQRGLVISPTLRWDAGISFRIPEDTFADAILCPPFLDVVASYFKQCTWHDTGQPCPVQALYLQFVADTGWVVPINIAQWNQAQVPPSWRSTVPSAWIHETSYEALKLSRQIFSRQCTTFLHVVKLLVRRFDLPISVSTCAAFAPFHFTSMVTALSRWPSTLQCGYDGVLKAAGASSLKHFFAKVFQPSTKPIAPRISQSSPADLWNAYFVSRRRRLR